MSLRGGVAALALCGVVSTPAAAWAQAFEWRGSVAVAGGYNYILPSSDSPTTNSANGPFMAFTPSLNAIIDTPQTRHTLTYGFTMTVPINTQFQLDSRPIQYSNRLNYALRIELDALTALNLTAGLTESPSYAFNATGDPSETPIENVNPASALNLQASAGESISRQLSPSLTFGQSLAFTYGNPIDPLRIRAKTYGVNNGFTLSNQFDVDTLSLAANVSFNHFTAEELITGGASDPRTQFLNGLTLTWRRPLTHALTMSLNAGVTETSSPQAAGATFAPSGGASLNYQFDYAAATLSLSHAMTVNDLTASVNSTDQVSLRFSVPFGQSGFTGSGTAGFVRASPVNPNGAPVGPSDNWTGDVGLTYTPKILAMISTSVRGQVQRAVPSDAPSLGFTRYGLTFSVTYSFPSATAARVAPSFSGLPAGGVGGEAPPTSIDRGPRESPPIEEPAAPAAP